MLRIPRQKRAQETYDRLIEAAGMLLAEVGVERISTNLVAARAGVTPPTLYHYFKDKYALLGALGERLMAAQNALVPTQGAPSIEALLVAHVQLTRGFPGGPWVMRMLRAVPQLADVRLNSHRLLAAQLTEQLQAADPSLPIAEAHRRARLAVELGYATIEMVFDEPELDVDAVMADSASAISAVLYRVS